MGEAPEDPLGKGEGMLIPTGGMLPEGADAVVMVEYLEDFGNLLYGVSKSVAPGENIIRVGEDVTEGKILLPCFSLIRAQEMGLLAAQGIVQIPVIARLKIGILSTGDEIVPPDITPSAAQTRRLNHVYIVNY